MLDFNWTNKLEKNSKLKSYLLMESLEYNFKNNIISLDFFLKVVYINITTLPPCYYHFKVYIVFSNETLKIVFSKTCSIMH